MRGAEATCALSRSALPEGGGGGGGGQGGDGACPHTPGGVSGG